MLLLYQNNIVNSEGFEVSRSNIMLPQMKATMALNQRKIFLYDDVDENSIFECIYYLNRLENMDNKIGSKEPIYIMINSNGGNVYDCLSLISLIEKMKNEGYKIVTVNMGRAFSCGFLLSIVGSERVSYAYSDYMFHDISSIEYGKLNTMIEGIKEMKRLRDKLSGIVMKYTNITKDLLDLWYKNKTDKYFSAEEALEYGIADKIV